MLADLGCDVIQGYHYARPMPLAQLRKWWATRDD
jgi:EAL domain-containing protein (putative c-di-GMP-specific phosphodiesterase class I)